MPHYFVTGMTESGKTTWAKLFARSVRKRGFSVLVLDPLCDPGFEADFKTDEPAEFLQKVFHPDTARCLLVVDESSIAVGRNNNYMERLATMARHKGHQTVFLMQQATQTSPIIRGNCGVLVCFGTGRMNAQLLAEEWAKPEILRAVSFAKGEYIFAPRFGTVHFGNVFEDLKRAGEFRK